MPGERTPVAVFGGSGYVAGEILRVLAGHPALRAAAVFSHAQSGLPVERALPHLAGTDVGSTSFRHPEEFAQVLEKEGCRGAFFATPHGETAKLVDAVLHQCERRGRGLHVVDLSADFRFREPDLYTRVYGKPHGAPERIAAFARGVPEHLTQGTSLHVAHPGCFTTAATLAAAPFLRDLGGPIFVSAVTGSSGCGRMPGPGTHHPERAHNLYAYAPLAHRHEAEMRALLGAMNAGREPEVEFVPHSGPFVRGIHATVRIPLESAANQEDLIERATRFYAGAPFIKVGADAPRLSDVVGTNRCHMGIAVRARTLVVCAALDNLVKGAAGGAVQWMNRLLGLGETTGLVLPGLGWY